MFSNIIRIIINLTWKPRYFINSRLYRYTNHHLPLTKLEKLHKNKPLLIIGNGPSLNETPLEEFYTIYSIAMNKIDLIYEKTSWRPSIIISVNNVVVKQHWKNFIKSKVPVFLAYKCRHIIPKTSRKDLFFFNLNDNKQFSTKFDKGIGSGETVTYAALQLAYYTGANPVIIFGVDHSFNTNQKDKMKYEIMKGADTNHFDPNYFQKGTLWGLPDLDGSEELYKKAKLAFEQAGRQVFDATINGKLQVFPKITIEEAKKLCDL